MSIPDWRTVLLCQTLQFINSLKDGTTITLAWRHLYFPSLVSCNKNILCASREMPFLALNTYTSFLRLTFYVAKLDWFVGAALLDSISRWDTPIAVRWSSSSISRGLTTECPNTPLLSSNFSGVTARVQLEHWQHVSPSTPRPPPPLSSRL